MGLWHTHGSPNLSQKTRPYSDQQKKKRTCKILDFAVPADHRIKLKECEKKDKYFDLARELKKLWNMKATIISIAIEYGIKYPEESTNSRFFAHTSTMIRRRVGTYDVVHLFLWKLSWFFLKLF